MELNIKEDQRVFVCGDIHGMYDFFMKALEELGFRIGKDVLVCTGDLIDRGPDSYKLLCHFLFDKTGSFFSVRGNHEQFIVDDDYLNHVYNGGSWINGFDTETKKYLAEQIEKKMPLIITINTAHSRYGVVHAEVEYGFKILG